jgi:hypothetical protein
MTTEKKPDFLEIKDEAMIAKILDVACKHQIAITLWLKSSDIKFETSVKSVYENPKRFSLPLPPEVDEGMLTAALAMQGSGDILGSFQLDKVNFFIKTTCAMVTEKRSLLLETPKQVFKLQRRANLRIHIPRSAGITLSLALDDKKDLPGFRVIDVSAGGVAFEAKLEDKDRFPDKVLLHNVRFKLRGTEIVAEGYVRHAAPLLNDKKQHVLKVGMEFTGLKGQFEKVIVQFVLDESRKMFSLLH